VVFVSSRLVLNAQFTWWVIFSLRETREQLDLERATILASTERAALRLQLRAEEEARRLVQAPTGLLLSARAAFTDVQIGAAGAQQRFGWIVEDDRTAFAWRSAAASGWSRRSTPRRRTAGSRWSTRPHSSSTPPRRRATCRASRSARRSSGSP